MKILARIAPLLTLILLLGCLSSAGKNQLKVCLIANDGFVKNMAITAAEPGGVTSNGNIIPSGAAKLKMHINTTMNQLIVLDAAATKPASSMATQNLVDNPDSAATYNENAGEAESCVKELHVLLANYVKNNLASSTVADDEELINNVNAALINLSNNCLGKTDTQAILSAITPAAQNALPTTPTAVKAAQKKKEEQK